MYFCLLLTLKFVKNHKYLIVEEILLWTWGAHLIPAERNSVLALIQIIPAQHHQHYKISFLVQNTQTWRHRSHVRGEVRELSILIHSCLGYTNRLTGDDWGVGELSIHVLSHPSIRLDINTITRLRPGSASVSLYNHQTQNIYSYAWINHYQESFWWSSSSLYFLFWLVSFRRLNRFWK